MSPAASALPAARVTPRAAAAFGGIWRLTARRFFTPAHGLILAGLLVLLVLSSIPAAPSREAAAQGFLPWASRFYVCFLVPILAFIPAAGLMRDDLQAETVDYVLTRPVPRSWLVVFRYLSHLACAQLEFLLALAVIAGIGVFHDVPGLGAALPRLLLAQVLVVTAFSAFGFLCAVLTSRYVIVGLAYGGIIEVGVGNVPTQLNRVSLIRQVQGLLRPITGPGDAGPAGVVLPATLDAPSIIALLLGFAAVMLAVTALLFALREFAGTGSRET